MSYLKVVEKYLSENHLNFSPSPGIFGKCIKIVFPNVNSRRLGSRGDSKYTYMGLRLKKDILDFPPNKITPEKYMIFESCVLKILAGDPQADIISHFKTV